MNDNNFAGNSNQMVDFLGNRWKFDCLGCAIVKQSTNSRGNYL